MQVELIFGVVTVLTVFFLFILGLVRLRGEIIRAWGNPVPYFPRMKPHKALRLKIRRGILQTLNKEIIKLIDNVILEEKQQSATVKLVPKRDVPASLYVKWLEIHEHPEKATIWATFAKRKWRWQGQKGRWVYFYHLFSHDEMTLRFGRHKVWRVKFLPEPIGFHAPTKEEWVRMRVAEAKKQKKTLNNALVKAFEKEYKREVKGRKWLLVMLHPTVTLMQEAQVFERLEGFQSLLPIIAHTMRTLGTKLAKYDALMASVKGFRGYQIEAKRTTEDLIDELGKTSTLVQSLQRSLEEKRIPVVASPESSPMPFAPKPRVEEKPSKMKQVLFGPFPWIQFTILLGFAGFVWGLLTQHTETVVMGGLMFVVGIFLNWREKRAKLPFVEEAKETLKETKESLSEEGA